MAQIGVLDLHIAGPKLCIKRSIALSSTGKGSTSNTLRMTSISHHYLGSLND